MIQEAGNRLVYFVYGSGGGGHWASAEALIEVLSERCPHWKLETVNISPIVGSEPGDRLYNFFMGKNWMKAVSVLHGCALLAEPLVEPILRAKIKRFWSSLPAEPDVVVSLVPFLNTAIMDSLPNAKHYTVLTDFTSSHVHPWIQHPEQTLFLGTEESHQQALDFGMAEKRMIRTSGMVVSPRFYVDIEEDDLLQIASSLNLRSTSITVLVCFGGVPPTAKTKQIVVALLGQGMNVIVLCGKNNVLLNTLKAVKSKHPSLSLHIKSMTKDVPLYMQLSDIVIGKPGPGVVSEALVSKKPLVLFNDRGRVMDQEKAVLQWVEKHGVGLGVTSVEQLGEAITAERIAELRKSVTSMVRNNAVYEVSDFLQTCTL